MRIQKKWFIFIFTSREVIPTRATETDLSRNISKFQKPDENIQNLNDDRYAYQDLGCTPIDLHVDNQINGDQVGKREQMYLILLLLQFEICSLPKNIYTCLFNCSILKRWCMFFYWKFILDSDSVIIFYQKLWKCRCVIFADS